MQIWCLMYGLRPREWFRLMGKLLAYGVSAALLVVSLGGAAIAQSGPLVLERNGRTISLEPYAPNILRVTMSIDKAAATGAPGIRVCAPSLQRRDGRTSATPEGYDVYRSARMVVRVAPGDLPNDKLPQPMPLDALNLELRQHYFGGGGGGNGPNDGGRGPHNDALLVTTAEGKTLLHMRTWAMTPERAEVAASRCGRKRLPGCGHVRLAGGRALLRIRAAAERLDGPAGSPDPLLA